jgi:Tol biopolymer transport system component
MTPERWEKIGELYHAARELDPALRAAFLAHACAGDEALRREVESLLAAEERAGKFIAAPALKDAAQMFLEEPAPSLVGRRLGHYQILAPLGAGGMGRVYRARDSRLGREVALKTLPTAFSADPERRRRFQTEARAAAALNHPNIATLHTVEEADGRHFITMEYVEGKPLSHHIPPGGLRLETFFRWFIPLADALVHAHAKGVTHRDIKPGNMMVTPDGVPKVLDFGLARIHRQEVGADATTLTMSLTRDGVVMGTPAYMSPEQAEGKEVDHRSDIFSFGVMMYEALTGQRPFQGESDAAIISNLLKEEPRAVTELKPETPLRLARLIEGSLHKDRRHRPQTMREVQAGLQEVKAAVEAGEDVMKPKAAGLVKVLAGVRRPMLGLVMLVALIAGLITWGVMRRALAPPQSLTRFLTALASGQQLALEATRLTATGNVTHAAISPDGKYVAYTVIDGPRLSSLWVRQLATLSSAQLIPPAEVDYRGVTFSHDGNYVYYVVREKEAPPVLYRVSLLGGPATKLLEDLDSQVSFSPDGRRFVFRRNRLARREYALVIAQADGTGEQELASIKSPESYGVPAWSPDGKVIACAAGHGGGGANRYVIEVRVADRTVKQISRQRWRWVGDVQWLPDVSGLMMTASEHPARPDQIWYLSYPGGEARRITNDPTGYNRLGVTADSSLLLAMQTRRVNNVWTVPADDPRRAEKITFGSGGYRGDLSWTPDGKIVYESATASSADLSLMDGDGSQTKQLLGDLTGSAVATSPAVSPDGQYVVFGFDLSGARHIWRINIDGSNPTQLTRGSGEDTPHCSPDGRWVVYTDASAERPTLWRVPMDGGEVAQLTKVFSLAPAVSPDGKLIACFYWDEEPNSRWKIAVFPFEGGEPLRVFPQPVRNSAPVRWTPDGRAVTYVDTVGSVSNLWLQPLEGGAPRPLTAFKSDLIFGFEWSRDGQRLACVRGIWERDLVLLTAPK